jgi:prevent-host-death family protein
MSTVPVRDLRNHTADVIGRVRHGDDITITSHGVPVATLIPVRLKKQSAIPRVELIRILRHQADPGLRDQLRELTADTTDDLGPIR